MITTVYSEDHPNKTSVGPGICDPDNYRTLPYENTYCACQVLGAQKYTNLQLTVGAQFV